MAKITTEQHQKLVAVKDAIIAAHEAMPDRHDMKLLHGLAERLVAANKSDMTDEQFQTLGGGTNKGD